MQAVWGLCRANLSEQDIEDSIARRAAARAAKDYAASDAEREFLASKGILIMDGANRHTVATRRAGPRPCTELGNQHANLLSSFLTGVGLHVCRPTWW